MTSSANPSVSKPSSKASEERLDEIRKAAADATLPLRNAPASHPQIRGKESYYGLPVLKAPVWTWEVPLYFFIGGVSGMSAALALAAQLFGSDAALIRTALLIALIGAVICPILLITDLGRPSRFLNMLRVFKLQSPMSMGAWILVAFSGCVFVAVVAFELSQRGYATPLVIGIRWAGEATGALTGLLLAAYTGVLIGATANPVWSHNRRALPQHFLASAVGGAAGVLELLGFLTPATQILGLVAAIAETLLGIHFELSRLPVNAPLHHGKSGITFRIGGLLAGPGALVLRLMSHSSDGRRAAAICFLAGSLLARYAWIWAGVASAKDPETLFQIQRKA
ncbi:MAG: NrfD/PsrC family molybdoenzyme membrane anchor subunit [Candidatus Sulfotelmatobacter sp.]